MLSLHAFYLLISLRPHYLACHLLVHLHIYFFRLDDQLVNVSLLFLSYSMNAWWKGVD